MHSLVFAILLVAVAVSAHPHHPHHKYHQVSNGTYQLATWEDGSFLSPPPQIPFHAEIIVPLTNDPSIKLGVYVWLTGFAGDCPIQFYETTMRYIASQGVIIVGLDRLENIDPYVEAPQLQTTINWISSGGLASEIASHNITVNIDSDAIIVGSHSSGAHTAVSMLLQECSTVKGLVLLSPVDGADPFGIVKEYCITPGQKVNFTLPMLNIVAGLDADHKPFAPACAPDFLSNNRFYDAMNGPVWQINGTGFGHADILDWILPSIGGLVCYRNDSLTQPELNVWRHAVAEMMWSFIGGILYGRTYLFDNLENSTLISTPVTLHYDYKSWTRESMNGGFCKHTNTTMDQQDDNYMKYHHNIHHDKIHHQNKHHDEKKHHHQHHDQKH